MRTVRVTVRVVRTRARRFVLLRLAFLRLLLRFLLDLRFLRRFLVGPVVGATAIA